MTIPLFLRLRRLVITLSLLTIEESHKNGPCSGAAALSCPVGHLDVAGGDRDANLFFFFFFFLNGTCVYAFAECREARDFVSQEVCSHARAGVLAKQCVCFSSSLSLTYVPLFSYPLLCDVCLLSRLTLFVACTPGKLWVSAFFSFFF